jgi:DNA/RNA endonuclease YhcR with UshA esterase domain
VTDGEGSIIQVPLFSSFVNVYDDRNRQKASIDELHKGALIEITGLIGEYQGRLQLVPKKPDDLKILYD